MRKIALFILLFSVVAVACIQQQDGPSEVVNANQETAAEEQEAQEAPRVEVLATPTLPPTYTPEPIGQVVHIAPVATRTIHVVTAGETMSQIAYKHGIEMKFLADSNRIYNYNLIKVGDVLYIPECE